MHVRLPTSESRACLQYSWKLFLQLEAISKTTHETAVEFASCFRAVFVYLPDLAERVLTSTASLGLFDRLPFPPF